MTSQEATPPPSLQDLARLSRSITPSTQPPASHLSSPPPTVGACIDTPRQVAKDALLLSDQEVDEASAEDLRSIVSRLLPALQEARTDAASYKLQYQMLTIETADVVERIHVEMDMAQRELEVLQTAEQETVEPVPAPAPPMPDVDPSLRSVHVDLYNSMIKDIRDFKARNAHHETTIAHQKRMIVQQESEIATLSDRVLLLRERLQENRDHLNRYRRTSTAPLATPRTETNTPHRLPVHSAHYSQGQRPFAALLHATDIMSNETPATPVTPKRKRGYVPSTPVTPKTVQPTMSRPIYETPRSSQFDRFKTPMSAPAPKMAAFTNRISSIVDAHESDGTVSASDDSEAETEVPDHEQDFQDSRASLFASDLLRTPTRSSGQHRGTNLQHDPLTQTRLFGQVIKGGPDRHDAARQAKRARPEDSVGLDIAGFRAA